MTKYRFSLVIIAIVIALSMYFGNNQISEAQSARHFLKWTIDCAKGEPITIKPKYDQAFDWKDPYTGFVERVVPLAFTCKTSTESVNKICKGYFITSASRVEPMNKTRDNDFFVFRVGQNSPFCRGLATRHRFSFSRNNCGL